jgi:hypothetical protein
MKRYLLKEWVAVGLVGLCGLPATAQVANLSGAASWGRPQSTSPYNAAWLQRPVANTPGSPPASPVAGVPGKLTLEGAEAAPQRAQLAPPAQGPMLEVQSAPEILPGPPVPITEVAGSPTQLISAHTTVPAGQPLPVTSRLQFQDCQGCTQQAAPGPAASAPVLTIEAAEQKADFPRAESAPPRRSFVDLSAPPCFGHAPDYCWLSGQVEYSRVGKEWRLRYASVDETDRYGGHVVLIESQHVSYLEDGQYVQVRGHLVSPESDALPAAYRIEAFAVVRDPNQPPGPPPGTGK